MQQQQDQSDQPQKQQLEHETPQQQVASQDDAAVASGGAITESASCSKDNQDAVMAKPQQSLGVNSMVSSSQRSHRSRKVNSSKPSGSAAAAAGALSNHNQSTSNSRGGGKHGGNTQQTSQRAEYHPPSASSKNMSASGHIKNQRSVRSTNKDFHSGLLLEESKQQQQPMTLASCQSNTSIVGGTVAGGGAGGTAAISKKESGVSLQSSQNVVAAAHNTKASNKAVMKNSKKRNQNKAGCTTGSMNSSAVVVDERKSQSRTKKNRNRIMMKSTSSVSVRDEVVPTEKIKNNTKSQKARGGSSHRAEGRDKIASSDMLKSSIRPSMKSISNWNKSQRSDNKRSNSYKQTAISQQAIDNIIGQNDGAQQPQDIKSPELIVEGQDIENTNGQEESQMSSPATNMPASPASKAPTLKSSALHSPPGPLNIDRQQNERIDELAEQENSPTSAADPIAAAASAVKLNTNNMNANSNSAAVGSGSKMTTFGIKLKKLEVSNMSVTKQNSIVDATPQSIINEQTPKQDKEVKLDKDGKVVRPEMTEPLPILPKVTTVINLPVKCPIENIRFLNLKRFLQFQKQAAEQMAAGYDLVGQRRKMLQRQTEDKLKKGGAGVEQLAKIDDTTHFIKSVVYARDPKIIDQERQHVPQRDAFQHLNNLDVKVLIQKSQFLNAEEGKFASLSPRTVHRRLPQQNQNRQFFDSQVYRLKDADDRTLLFESRFESGNLYLAQKVSEVEYNLLMQNDINTQGHTQWFFFQVKNTRAGQKVKFNILNYSKPDSLFNYGMKISVYSDKKSEEQSIGWHKDCEDIRYFMNGIRKDVTNYTRSYYTATFTYTFEYDDDTVYFAYSVPYTYSDLRNDLAAIESDPHRSKLVRKATLCRTLSGEQCEVLTITSADNLQNFSKRKGVVITARVHPGETVGSWMMRGVLTFLTDPDNFEARMLRENFVFKVVPMLNPDGVINGNYRCSLAGCDLNRRWKVPNKTLHPTIWHTKRMVKSIHQERGLVMFCDLHGHSRKQNVFMYGCNNKNNPGECRIFPFILGQMNPYFCYEYSRFGVQKSKEATARVALYKELVDVPNIFTMESSFAGCDEGSAAGKHLTTDMLETLGHDCCRAILIYCNMHVPPELQEIAFFKNIFLQQQAAKNKQKSGSDLDKKKFKEPVFDLKDAINSELNANKALLAGSGGDDSSSGSDSAPSEDNMQAEELVKQLPVADKTLKQQLKKNEQKRKQEDKEKAQAEQSQAKLRKQSSLRKEDRDAPKRQLSPLKRAPQNVQLDKKEDTKAEEKKKPKVETRDACTQTDRSDYQLIKQKMLKERQLKEEQAALAQNQQLRGKGGVSTERQLINDLNGNNRNTTNTQDFKKPQSFNTTQRLQQMVGLQDSNQVRINQNHQKQMPLSSHFSQNPLMNQIQSQYNRNGNPLSNPQSTRNEQSSLLGLGAMPPNQQNINLPDKKKYNFMGVSSINNQSGAPQTTIQENEYGTVQPPSTEPTPSNNGIFQNNSELPSMTGTLSAKSSKHGGSKHGGVISKNQSQIKQNSLGQQQYMSGPSSINGKLAGNQNASSDQGGVVAPQRMRNDLTFSPMRKGTGGPSQNAMNTAQLSLPQAKQLPQKEFVMLEVGKAAKGVRKGSRNPKSNTNNLMLMGSQNPNNMQSAATPFSNGASSVGNPMTSQNHYNSMSKQFNNSTGNHRQYQPALSSEQSEHQETQNSRFKKNQMGSQQPQPQSQQQIMPGGVTSPSMQGQQKQLASLVRNNSMILQQQQQQHGTANSHNVTSMGSGGNQLESTPVVRASPADQYSTQLQEMTLSQTLVTRNTPANISNSAKKTGNPMNNNSVIEPSSENSHYRAALSGPLGQQAGNSNLARYKAAVGGDGKLPALNVRGGGGPTQQQQQAKSGRSEFANSSGVIGGLNIVLNSGQSTIQTPQQKKPNPPMFQMSAHSQKIHTNSNLNNNSGSQPQQQQPHQQPMKMIGPSMHLTSSHTAASTNLPGANKQPPCSVNRNKSDSKTSMHKQQHQQQPTLSNSVSRQKQHWQSHTCDNPNSSTGAAVQGSGVRSNQLGTGSQLQIQTSSATHKRNTQRPIFIGPQTTTNASGGAQGNVAVGGQPGSLSHESGQMTMRQQAEHLQNRDMQQSSPTMFTSGGNHHHNMQMMSVAGGQEVGSISVGAGAATKKQRTHQLLSNNSMSAASNSQLQGKVVGKRYSRH